MRSRVPAPAASRKAFHLSLTLSDLPFDEVTLFDANSPSDDKRRVVRVVRGAKLMETVKESVPMRSNQKIIVFNIEFMHDIEVKL